VGFWRLLGIIASMSYLLESSALSIVISFLFSECEAHDSVQLLQVVEIT